MDFAPNEYVRVKLFELDYPGRVQECVLTGEQWVYIVKYASDGELRTGRFRADELESAEEPFV